MNLYTNGFRLAVRSETDGGGEIIISFVQNSPEVDNDGKIGPVITEPVTSLVMNPKTANALAEALTSALEESK